MAEAWMHSKQYLALFHSGDITFDEDRTACYEGRTVRMSDAMPEVGVFDKPTKKAARIAERLKAPA